MGRAWAGPLTVAATFAALLLWSFGRWTDPQVDFGRELYVPWQLAQGAVLYRDIGAIYGPLSQYVNAAWFAAFGPGLWVLIVLNAMVFAALLILLYRLAVHVAGRVSATVSCLLVVSLSGFGQYDSTANFNFMTPYAHEATHGLLLAFAGLACLRAFLARQRPREAVFAGLTVGAAFLTKLEPFLGALAATSVGVGLGLWSARAPAAQVRRTALAYAGGCLAAPVVAYALLWTAMPAGEALRGVLGSWPHVLKPAVRDIQFFRAGMGTDDVGFNLARSLLSTARCAAVALAAAGLAFALRGASRRVRRVACALAFGAVATALLRLGFREFWTDAGRPLPWFVAAGLLVAAGGLRAQRDDPGAAERRILSIALLVLALVMLLKMIFNARFLDYGFVLALPATALVAVMAIDWIPGWLERRGAAGAIFRASALAVVAAVAVVHVQVSSGWWASKTLALGSGRDRFMVGRRGQVLVSTLEILEAVTPPDSTLVVLPEGVMLNYLARRRNPTPYITFIPSEMLMFGERRMLESLQAEPPDLIVLLQRSNEEYGYGPFGTDYAQAIDAWVAGNYRPIGPLIGPVDVKRGAWARILARRDLAQDGAP